MISMQSRFRGALYGVLVGDCFGAPFEGMNVNPTTLAEQIEDLLNSTRGPLRFTDDTAMTIATCKSLIQNRGLDPRHLAKEYSETYFSEPKRGYGAAVRQVFCSLRDTNYQDPYGPASNQFYGKGSFGNGAAMRCNGIALFAHKNNLNESQALDLVENCSRITHSHIYGIHGAVLLVAAIRYVLSRDEESFNDNDFLDYLIRSMSELEDSDDHIFSDKLKTVKRVLDQLSITGEDVTQREIVSLLGNDVSAQNSVPLAIYSFLRGISKFTDSYRLENEFVRTLHWAISCGGDTDTIASMACGLSGAYLGQNKVPENLYKKCESWEEMRNLADQLAS